jgi:hypothetical protein
MIPFDLMPCAKRWAKGLMELAAHQGLVWVWGPFGSGVTTLSRWLAEQRGTEAVEYDSIPDLDAWLKANPLGVVASERPISCDKHYNFIELRLWPIDDDPASVQSCLEYLAREEGVESPLPSALGQLPCGGNLTELRNRIIRWRLLGQAPEPEAKGNLELLEAEDIASNLHILERVLLHRALRRSYGNRVEAAKRLGISRRQLYLLINRHGDPVRGTTPVGGLPKRLGKQK